MDVGESYRLARGGSRDLPEAKRQRDPGAQGWNPQRPVLREQECGGVVTKVEPWEGKALISLQRPPTPPPTSELLLAENKSPWCTLPGDGGGVMDLP